MSEPYENGIIGSNEETRRNEKVNRHPLEKKNKENVEKTCGCVTIEQRQLRYYCKIVKVGGCRESAWSARSR